MQETEEWKDIGCIFDKSSKSVPKKLNSGRNCDSQHKGHSDLMKKMNTSRPSKWYEDAAADGLLEGTGKCAKRLRRLDKRDRRKLKKVTEPWADVRIQLGKELWKQGMIGISRVGKSRGVRKSQLES